MNLKLSRDHFLSTNISIMTALSFNVLFELKCFLYAKDYGKMNMTSSFSHLATAGAIKMAGTNVPGGGWPNMYNILSTFSSRIKVFTCILTKLINASN